MDKKNLQNILNKRFNINDWQNLLADVFGVKNFLLRPSAIPLPNNKKADAAFELGSFNTADDRIIGLYLVKVKPEVWIERNKVGLRELLRSIYKYDVDGALIVFEQAEKWRLSFVSEIRIFDDDGNLNTKITDPKRYTYLLGDGEKVKTPVDRLAAISGKKLYLEEIRNAFSVEALNEEFYKVVARQFYQLVGAVEGKGSKAINHKRLLQLPGITPNNKNTLKIYHEFAVRLIGRIVFSWFLKVKKSEAGISLLPEHLLSLDAVKNNEDYYHSIVERLFFQTLNTPMDKRISGLPLGCEQIPFLNGGLFENQPEDYYKLDISTGLSENVYGLIIPNSWFKDFFENLEQYNFTIDENSVVDIEVSVDPEMLGRIFENLLAEIDPDSGETARKATGSFYTPREIVDYMATESLLIYLVKETNILKDDLAPIFKIDSEVSFLQTDNESILEALDRLKILDPACGSGAFPMGVLQKIVMALQKLDPLAEWWKQRQINRIENMLLRKHVRDKLQFTTVEYARKIGIIQNTLYGVDIQPIAAEISKLRCFLTLIVDENIDETKENRGIEPLPNLEFKFVTANTLLKLPNEQGVVQLVKGNKKNTLELEDDLHDVRQRYLQSTGEEKLMLKRKFEELQKQIFDQQGLFGAVENSRAHKISIWKPFGNEMVNWFDPLWMYGVNEFDIVIGNPPYVSALELKKSLSEADYKNLKKGYETAKGTVDLFIYFFERGLKLLKENGQLVYISPNRYLSASYGEGLREYVFKNARINEIIDYSHVKVFKTASTYPVLTFLTFKPEQHGLYDISIGKYNEKNYQINYKKVSSEKLGLLEGYIWGYLLNEKLDITEKVMLNSVPISECAKINATSTASEADEYHDLILDNVEGGFKLINTGTIDRYQSLWGKQPLTDKGSKFLNPYLPKNTERISKNRKSLYSSPKIILAKIAITTEAFLDINGEFASVNTNCFHSFKDGYNPKYILAWLNSKLFQYTFECFFEGLKMQGGYLLYSAPNVSKMFIKKMPDHHQGIFANLIDYILLLIKFEGKNQLNEFVENTHIIQLFEEIIDAIVYEAYFTEDFASANINFMEYALRDFKSIENLGESEATDIINDVYNKLREKDNEIRQNLKLMDTRLSNLIMPIKISR